LAASHFEKKRKAKDSNWQVQKWINPNIS